MSDFQGEASRQGREFEQSVVFSLRAAGWTIDGTRVVVAGVEIDIVATDPDGVQWWIECKGSHRGKTPGTKRGDTTKKAVGVAAYLSTLPARRPYWLITSHLPKRDTVSDLMLAAARAAGWFDRISEHGSFRDFDEPAQDDLPEDD